jgi:hypothetical protein
VRAVSASFLSAIRGSHDAVFRARVCSTFQTGSDPDGVEIAVLGGDVKSSASAEIRSTLDLTTSEAWPRTPSDLITPYGNEIYVERGIDYGNGRTEWVGLGYFRIETPEQDTVPDGVITLSGSDRMAGIRDARFLAPRQFPALMTRGDVVELLIREVYPSAAVVWDDAVLKAGSIGRTIITEDDRLGCLRDLLTSVASVGYFDHRGVFVVKPAPTASGAAVFDIDAGTNGVLIRMSRALTREGVYNAVVATGEAGDTAAPARAVVANLDPNSPTYYRGRFGPVPMFYSSPFLTTNAQALASATALLRKQLGLPYQVDLEAVPNPALEPGDVVRARYPRRSRSRSLLTEKHVLDEVTIPLDATSPVVLKTRVQQNETIGAAE